LKGSGGDTLAPEAHDPTSLIAAPSTEWKLEDVPLRFEVGKIRLGSAKLQLFRRSASLDEAPLDGPEIPAPPPDIEGAMGYVVWSHPVVAPIPAIRWREQAIVYVPRQYRRFLVSLSGDYDVYFARFSAKTRSTLKRKLRRFSDASGAPIDARVYRSPTEMTEFLTLAREVSAKSYQERLLDKGLPDGACFSAAVQRLAEKDSLRGYLLFFRGKPISYLFCPISDGIVLYDYVGYDPAHAALSPGTVLYLQALQSLFAERRHRYFDFTEGEGEHKRHLATHEVLCADIFVVSRRLPILATILLHRAHNASVGAFASLVDRLGIGARLRRLVRSM